jgi:hypothetical protein
LLLLAAVLRGLYLPDPWSGLPNDFHNHFGAFATGGPATHFVDQGLFATRGMPTYFSIELADGSRLTDWYSHHPAGYMLISALFLWVFGTVEWALRLPALLFSLVAVWAVARLAERWAGTRAGLWAGFVMALVPFSVHFGVQVWTEAALVGCGALFLTEFLAWRQGASGRAAPMALAIGMGGLLDWPIHFFWAPAALAALWIDWRRALRLWPVPLVAVLTIGLHWLHVQLSQPALEHAADRANTLSGVFQSPVPADVFWGNQLRFWLRYCTWPVVLIALLGACAKRRPAEFGGIAPTAPGHLGKPSQQPLAEPQDRSALVATSPLRLGQLGAPGALLLPFLGLLPGVIYVCLFPGRSFDHSFFGMLALPGVALLFAAGCLALERTLRQLQPRWGAPLTLLLLLVLGLWLEWRNLLLWSTQRSPQIGELVAQDWLEPWIEDPDAVLLTHMGRGMCLPFYSRAQIVHSVNSPADLERYAESLLKRLPSGCRVAFLVDGMYLAALPEGLALAEALGAYGQPERHSSPAGDYALWVLR